MRKDRCVLNAPPVGAPDVEKKMTNDVKEITVEALLEGSIAIERQKDETARFFQTIKPALKGKTFIGERFTIHTLDKRFWWELRGSFREESFLQLWKVVNIDGFGTYWQGNINYVPPAESVEIVRQALPFLLTDCLEKVEGFSEKIRPYL